MAGCPPGKKAKPFDRGTWSNSNKRTKPIGFAQFCKDDKGEKLWDLF